MAEVNRHLGKGSYNILRFKYKRYILDSQKKGNAVLHTLSFPEGVEKCRNVGLLGAENAQRVTAGVQDGYERVTSVLGNVYNVYEKENGNYLGLKVVSPVIKNRVVNSYWGKMLFRSTFSTFRTQQSLHSRCLCRSQGEFMSVRAYSGNGSNSQPLYKTKSGYYDILEVKSDATQAQIKTAYYKQSFMYHPDRNAGSDEATVRFSEISEAYTVLANKALRKKYDRGLLSQMDLNAAAKPSSSRDTSGSSTRQQSGTRRSVMGFDSKGGIYDFDKFYKTHYGEQLQRQKDMKARREQLQKQKQESSTEKRLSMVSEATILLMLMVGMAILMNRG